MLKILSKDYNTLPADLFDDFKAHLRILDPIEDASIKLYLSASIDAISTFADRDIFFTQYQYKWVANFNRDYNGAFWRCPRVGIRDVVITNDNGVDVTVGFTIDESMGFISPTIRNDDTVEFSCGYISGTEVPPNAKSIIFRYGAHLYENREAINIGEPKNLPDWVNYAIASLWVGRV